MDNNKMIWIVCLLMAIYPAKSDDVCKVTKNIINCKNRHLDNVPDFPYTPNCEAIYLNYNNIHTIPANAFEKVSNTTEIRIYLDHNQIRVLDENAFEDLEEVTVRLFLQQNNFAVNASLKALETFTKLTHLRLDGIDSLDKLPVSAINESLEYLSLGLDNFTVWPVQLQKLPNLHTLTLYDIPKTNFIPTDAFTGVEQSLEFLEIKNSAIDTPLDAICILSNLQSLTLDFVELNDPNITFPQCVKALDSVWLLSLRFVSFENLPNLFDTFPSITSLEVSFNEELQHISEEVIPTENMFAHVNLMSNGFRQVPFAIQKMKSLEILDLSHNLISAIENNDFGNHPKLRRLVINNNPIVFISEHAFSEFPALTYIDMRDLRLETAPEALKEVENLTTVDLLGNPLICDCKMSWLVSSSRLKIVKGTCSDTNQTVVDLVGFLKTCKP